MKNIYCIEHGWLIQSEEFTFIEEFNNEEKFKQSLINFINLCHIIKNVFIKEVNDNEINNNCNVKIIL